MGTITPQELKDEEKEELNYMLAAMRKVEAGAKYNLSSSEKILL